jgi:hypothetical protein
MRIRWQVALPIFGLFLFALQTYGSFQLHRQFRVVSDRYFYWSAIRLDSRSGQSDHQRSGTYQSDSHDEQAGLREWDWANSSPIGRALMVIAAPAFAICGILVSALAQIGISEVPTFMILLPTLQCVWLYFVGLLIQKLLHRKRKAALST